MRTNLFLALVVTSVSAFSLKPSWAESPKSPSTVDIKLVAPADAFLAVYARHNPARDDQRAYFADAWKTFQDEQIVPRLMNIITSRMPQDKLATAKEKMQEFQTALEPFRVHALLSAEETVVVERMEGPFNAVVFATRLTPDDVADCERGVTQGFDLMAQWSNGKVSTKTDQVGDVTIKQLSLPKESPFQPAVARVNDILLVGTSVNLLRSSVEQLQSATAKSKFDDPRLKDALGHLHKADDALVFFDGQQMFKSLRGIGDFIRAQSKNDPKATRVATVMEQLFDKVAILDYVVTVEYTEPGQNHSVSLIKMADGYEQSPLGRAITETKPVENWQKWIPSDATSFSVQKGVNLHELYQGIVGFVREQFPESQPALEKFAKFQEAIGVNLDRDILQSFSGQSFCMKMPVTMPDGSNHSVSVTALKCENPDKIRELLKRGIDALSLVPAIQMQQLKLEDSKLEGFQQLHAACFQMFGAQPVIGFRDGWMIISSCPEGAEKLIAVQTGKEKAIDVSALFAKYGVDSKQVLCDISYEDIGAGIRRAADLVDKVGSFVPMFLSMAAANAKPEEIKPVQEAVELLPSIAKVIRKFDFFGHNLSVVHAGPVPNTYLKESVTEIHKPKGS